MASRIDVLKKLAVGNRRADLLAESLPLLPPRPVTRVPTLEESEAQFVKMMNNKIAKYTSKNSLNNNERPSARAVLLNYNSRSRRPRVLNSAAIKKLRKLVNETNVTAGLFKQADPMNLRPRVRRTKVNFGPNVFAYIGNDIVNIISKVATTAQAKKALVGVPPPAQAALLVKAKNVKPAVLKAFNSDALALAIVQMVKVPPAVAKEGLSRPKVAPVIAASIPAPDLANIIVSAIRNRTPVPQVVRRAVANRPEVRAEIARQVENIGGRVSENAMKLIENALKKPSTRRNFSIKFPSLNVPKFPSLTVPKFPSLTVPKFPSLTVPKFPSLTVPKWPWTGRARSYTVYVWNSGVWVPIYPSSPLPQQPMNPPPQNAPPPPQGFVPVQGPNRTVIGVPVTQLPPQAQAQVQKQTKQMGTQMQKQTKQMGTQMQKQTKQMGTQMQVGNQTRGGAGGTSTSTSTSAGGTGGGATVSFNPTITIGLNKLPQLVQQARVNPEKVPELQKVVENLKKNLPQNSETRKAVETLFKEPNKIPSATLVTQTLKRSYKNMNFNELIAARKLGKNKGEINSRLREEVRAQIRRIGRLSSSERGYQYSSLYKSLPQDFSGREEVERVIRQELREMSRGRDPVESRRRLNNWRRNFGSSLPSRVREEYDIQSKRALQNERTYARRYPERYERSIHPPLRSNQSRPLRQAAPRVQQRSYPMKQEGPLRQGSVGSGNQVVLPSNQIQALNKVGGVNAALATVAAVPGGAPQVALAAQALNETNGNRQKAVELKGVDPAAMNAVNKLGGARNAGYILEGLNTLSRKTPKRRSGVKKQVLGIRITELNRVINSVKKRKLISLVAHNVTKTNIHADENRKKKYYKKVIKSNILRKGLASRVRQAAKKKSNVKAKA